MRLSEFNIFRRSITIAKNNTATDATQATFQFSPPDQEQLDISTLETWLWDTAGEVSFHAHPEKRISATDLNRSGSCERGYSCHSLTTTLALRFRDSTSSI